MTLLFLTLAYLTGLFLGSLAWQQGWLPCDLPSGLWLLPLALLPGTALLPRRGRAVPSMTWPASAGFQPPVSGLSPGLKLALGLALLTGLLRYASHPLQPCWTPQDLAWYNASADQAFDRSLPAVTVQGVVINYPVAKEGRQILHLRVTELRRDGVTRRVQGLLCLKTGRRSPRFVYGQPVQASGRLTDAPVFDGFDYRAYLARKGIHSVMNGPRVEPLPGPNQGSPLLRGLYALRARAARLLERLLPEPYAALANGMLLGIEAGIPDELYDQFNLTGTSHVIVISGSNVALIAGVLMAFGVRLFGRRRALLPTLAGIGLYALLVGGDPAVMRAALMGSLFVVAASLERQTTALVSLAAACWAMTLLNPLTLWDVGFQLSSAATAGLILFSPKLSSGLARLWPAFAEHRVGDGLAARSGSLLRGLLQDGLLVTLAANLTTLPLVVYYFGRLSLVSLLTNLLIAPVQPFIMLWGGAGILAGLAGLTPVAQLLLWIPWLSLAWTVSMVRWTASLPGASLEIQGYGPAALGATYGLLALFTWRGSIQAWWRERQGRGGLPSLLQRGQTARLGSTAAWTRWIFGPAAFGSVAVAGILLWSLALTQPDGRLHVTFLDIGQGDGILIQTPSGRQVLVDGGNSPQLLLSELGAAMPFWDRSLDLLVMTHPDLDHMGAQAAVVERYRVGMALASGNFREHEDARPWQEAMTDHGIPIQEEQRGGWIDLGDGVALWVLWPPREEELDRLNLEEDDKNERSLVLKLVYGQFSVLLTGDAGLPSEAAMLADRAPVASHVLKVGHHGSLSSTSAAFVQGVRSSVAVIQVGENRYGHPREEVLERLQGQWLLRNDQHGRIHVWSDGVRMWVETERGDPSPPNGVAIPGP